MKKGQLKFLLIPIVAIVASIVTGRAIGHRYLGKTKESISAADTAYRGPVYDKAVLAEFQGVCHRYDSLGKSYTVAGTLSVRDGADTAGNLKDIPFLCCRNGEELYYRMGKTETINVGGLYIYIDHQAKTILLSGHKEMANGFGPKIIPDFGKQLASEDYQLSRKQAGSQQIYSLINEHHISCKEYSLAVDSLSGKITHIRARLSNAQDPLRKDNEKLIEVSFSRWDTAADIKNYTSAASVLGKSGNGWLPIKDCANYQLIKM